MATVTKGVFIVKNTRVIVTDAMLMAMQTVLSIFSITLPFIKFSLATLPVVIAGLMFGPVHGFIVGFIGHFIYQMITYGFSLFSVLYALAYGVIGLIAGLLGSATHLMDGLRGDDEQRFIRFSIFGKEMKVSKAMLKVALISIVCTTALTLLNTGVIYAQSKAEGWYTVAGVFGSLGTKLLKNLFLAAAYMLLLPPILREAVKFFNKEPSAS